MRAPVRTITLTATVIAAFAIGGCKDTGSAAPSGSPTAPHATTTSATDTAPASPAASHPAHTKPATAGPGTTCGKLVTPGKYAAKVVIGRGHLPCATAVQVVKRYYRGVQAGHGGGNTAALRVGRYFCQSTTAAGSQGGRLGSCGTSDKKVRIKIEAQTDTD